MASKHDRKKGNKKRKMPQPWRAKQALRKKVDRRRDIRDKIKDGDE